MKKSDLDEELYNSLKAGKLNNAIFVLNQKIEGLQQRFYIIVSGLSLLILILSIIILYTIITFKKGVAQ